MPVDISNDHNLDMSERYRGALLTFSCEDDYVLFGNKEVYCNGRVWSSDIPHCKGQCLKPIVLKPMLLSINH